ATKLRPPVVLPSKIELTDKAVAEAHRIMEKQNLQNAYVRLGVKGGGCSGMSYTMTFDTNVSEKDKIFDYDLGVKVAVDVKSFLFLRGMILDFSDDLMGGGFKFENPNAKRTCSCGTSFSA
ncbi:MAG TPA: iron-sulfur cluster assembly accessory protein, partial [Candidatus Xenobia bacterium]